MLQNKRIDFRRPTRRCTDGETQRVRRKFDSTGLYYKTNCVIAIWNEVQTYCEYYSVDFADV